MYSSFDLSLHYIIDIITVMCVKCFSFKIFLVMMVSRVTGVDRNTLVGGSIYSSEQQGSFIEGKDKVEGLIYSMSLRT